MKGIRKKLAGALCLCMTTFSLLMGPSLKAEAYTDGTHPMQVLNPGVNFEIAPDGTGWTVVDPLPLDGVSYIIQEDGSKYYTRDTVPFWLPYAGPGVENEKIQVNELTLVSDGLTEGYHIYKYERMGEIPIYEWECIHQPSHCIQTNRGTNRENWHMLGNLNSDSICGQPYWSGWSPFCADCGECIEPAIHYLKTDTVRNITSYYIEEDCTYYYECPYCNHLEQGVVKSVHDCDAISPNKYYVEYDRNGQQTDIDGIMTPSAHYYNNADDAADGNLDGIGTYDGEQVTVNTKLSRNNYTRSGYVFAGWNTEPDGSGTFYEDEADIFNLTTEQYNEDEGTGIITLYAQWEKSNSTLIIDANGGSYYDTKGSWNAENTTRTYADIRYGTPLAVKSGNITPPAGCDVTFEENGGSAVPDDTAPQQFVCFEMVGDFKGEYLNEVYKFTAPDGHTDILKAVYEQGGIILPETEKEGYNFGGWYEDPEFKEFAGFGGDFYIPSIDGLPWEVTLYANWVDLTLQAEPMIDTSRAGGKGYAYLTWSQKDNSNKAFKLYRKLNGEAESSYVEVVKSNAEGGSVAVSESYNFSGTSQKYTVPYTGLYSFEVYGAQGGNYGSYVGGKGGKMTGSVWLTKGDELTITVGGQNGYNGGGSATSYAKGGGASTIVSKNLGTLFIAGGGGGASGMYNGGEGGASTNVLGSGSTGEGGMSGGGGGYKGGKAGEVIYHDHETLECTYHTHDGNATSGGLCYKTILVDCPGKCDKEAYNYYRCLYCGYAAGNQFHADGWAHKNCDYTPEHKVGYECSLCGKDGSKDSECDGLVPGYELNCSLTWMCGKAETDIESSKAAYGGSSYSIGTAKSVQTKAGEREGNGYVKITAENVGYLSDYAYYDLKANDLAKPEKINDSFDNVSVEANGANQAVVSWDILGITEDNGTKYDHLCKSFAVDTQNLICTSNMTTIEVKTGVKKYYYIYDLNTATTVTNANRQGVVAAFDASDASYVPNLAISIPAGETRYLHVAAVDQAGNVGETIHIEVFGEDIEWDILTEQMEISSVIGGTDRKSVYEATDGRIFVKADGRTPFLLGYESKLDGSATEEYQIDKLYVEVEQVGASGKQEFYTQIPHIVPPATANAVRIDPAGMNRYVDSNSGTLFYDGSYSTASRFNRAVNVDFEQAFSVPASLHGSTLFVYPQAGATYTAENGTEEEKLSVNSRDRGNGLTLYPDGEAPIIAGTDVLRNCGTNPVDGVVLQITASDAHSGVKDITVKVTNRDNFSTATYTMNASGVVQINVDSSQSVLFNGDVAYEITAVDNVGNVRTETYGSVALGLTASLDKTGVQPRGTGVILDFTSTGYAEYVNVIWPSEFDPALPTVFDYTSNPSYAKTEVVGFILPINGTQSSYEIKVQAYKDGRMVEEVLDIQAGGSILDDLRVRIR